MTLGLALCYCLFALKPYTTDTRSQSRSQADHSQARRAIPFRKRIALYAHDSDPDTDIPICYKSAFYIIDLVSLGRAEWLTPKSAKAILPGQAPNCERLKSAHADWYTSQVSNLPNGQHLNITTKQLDA